MNKYKALENIQDALDALSTMLTFINNAHDAMREAWYELEDELASDAYDYENECEDIETELVRTYDGICELYDQIASTKEKEND